MIVLTRLWLLCRYRHHDKPGHPHQAKDWVGVFFLLDDSDDIIDKGHPVLSGDQRASTAGHYQQDGISIVRSKIMQGGTCKGGVENNASTKQGKPTAYGTVGAGGTDGRKGRMVGWRTLPPENEVRDWGRAYRWGAEVGRGKDNGKCMFAMLDQLVLVVTYEVYA